MPLKRITFCEVNVRLSCEYENLSSIGHESYEVWHIQDPVEYDDRFVEYPDYRVIDTNTLSDEEGREFEEKAEWCFDQSEIVAWERDLRELEEAGETFFNLTYYLYIARAS